jgi:DNA-binding CsgD family transcriptional regulator
VPADVERRLAQALPQLYALRPAEEFPAHALAVVRAAVGGDKAEWTELDLGTGAFRVLVDRAPPALAGLAEARRAYMGTHPVLRHFRRTAVPDARLISDFTTRTAWHRSPLYGEFFAHVGVEDQLTALVSAPASTLRIGVSVDRDRPGFERDDRRLLDALRPHVAVARANALRLSAALARPAAPDGALDVLTDRQRAVLARIARGLTDAQIALELGISPRTVGKHVEHVLRRLGTHTRTAAAARWLVAGSAAATPWTAELAALD